MYGCAQVTVTNTGKMDADDVVLGFMVPPGAGVDGVPLQTLFGFERVHVPAGQSVSVYLYRTNTQLVLSLNLHVPESIYILFLLYSTSTVLLVL